jgi:hypothetical protein
MEIVVLSIVYRAIDRERVVVVAVWFARVALATIGLVFRKGKWHPRQRCVGTEINSTHTQAHWLGERALFERTIYCCVG